MAAFQKFNLRANRKQGFSQRESAKFLATGENFINFP
jgi:hypothetical protein